VSDSLLDILVLLFSFSFVIPIRLFLLAYGVHVEQTIACSELWKQLVW